MVVYILQWKGIPTYDSVLTGINLLTYFKGKVTTMLVANSRELRFIIIGSDFKWVETMENVRERVPYVARASAKLEQKYFVGFPSSLQT